MPQPNWVVNIGAGKETTWGTPVAPTVFLSSPAPVFNEKQDNIFDRGLRGIRSATNALTFGAGHAEITIPNMPWYADDSGNLIMAMLGADAVTSSGGRTGSIGAVSAGATSATYTPGVGGASVTGDVFVIDKGVVVAGVLIQEVVKPTSIAANVWTLPAPGFKFNHGAAATAATLYEHTISMLNTGSPPSYTVLKYDALNTTLARQIAGVYFESVHVKFTNPGALTVEARGRGKMGTNVTKVTPSYSTEPFNVPWQASFNIAGGANARMTDFEFTITAANDQIFGMNNTQSPTAAVSDQLSVTGKLTAVPDDYTEFNYYINNTQPPIILTLDNGQTQTIFQMSKCAFIDPMTLEHSGNYSMVTGSFEAIANSTDAGASGNAAIKVITRNARVAAY